MKTSAQNVQTSIRRKLSVSVAQLLVLSIATFAGASYAQQPTDYQGDAVRIELHNQVPTVTNQSILGANASRASAPGNGKINANTTRIVLYVGGNERPLKGTFCGENPEFKTIDNIRAGHVLIASALCKGNRELSVADTGVPLTALDPSELPKTLKSIKSDLVYVRQENRFSNSIEGGM